MLVHIQIALSQQPQIKPAVPRKQFQHVIKEPYTSGNLILSRPSMFNARSIRVSFVFRWMRAFLMPQPQEQS